MTSINLTEPSEREANASFGTSFRLKDFWEGAGLLFKHPVRFFAGMSKSGGYAVPVVYALVWLFVSTLVELGVSTFRPVPVPVSAAVQIGWLVIGPVLLLGIGFILSGILFMIWRSIGSRENYQTAFRCWAFIAPVSAVGAVLSAVPYLNLLSFFYCLGLLAVASVHVHGVNPKRAWGSWIAIGVIVAAGIFFLSRAERSESSLPRAADFPTETELGEIANEVAPAVESPEKANP